MGAIRLEREHYAAFSAPEADKSRKLVKGQIWPELRRLSEALIPGLSQLVGIDLHPHLAFQGGREGPVREAFTAFSASRKKFRDHPHFTLAVNRSGVHARVSLVRSRGERERLARVERAVELGQALPMAGLRPTSPGPTAATEPAPAALNEIALMRFLACVDRSPALAHRRPDIGFGWSSSRARTLAQIEIMTAFERLAPIYRLMASEEDTRTSSMLPVASFIRARAGA